MLVNILHSFLCIVDNVDNIKQEGLAVAMIARDDGSSSTNLSPIRLKTPT